MSGRKIAIVGGGMAGLAAAWQLSRPGGDRPEVTVYERGSRLGGKGASSRGPNGRIEEHGLHVWLGFYDNAFRLLRACYEELDRAATDPGLSDPDVARRVLAGERGRPRAHRRGGFAALVRTVSRERPPAGRAARRRRAHPGELPRARARAVGPLRRLPRRRGRADAAGCAELVARPPGLTGARGRPRASSCSKARGRGFGRSTETRLRRGEPAS